MKKKISIVFILKNVSVIFLISPVIIYWLLNGNYYTYLWIINGSDSFSYIGSGPLQLLLYITLLLIGIITGSISIILKKSCSRKYY